ncbi:MAG: mandelate racemase/muconate lactonizing enzyme family protein [Candidatus Lambdaproteobacteria bacterium]|nr:mandelate racemase/muconate lactonizing enzyme family protein [Candidatus Lambdaproteobacteria bacterium]
MIIKEVRSTVISVPFVEQPRNVLDSKVERKRDMLVVEIETKSGIVGMGYIQLLGPGIRSVAACLEEVLRPMLLGQDATHVERLWRQVWQSTYRIGRMGVPIIALSACDIALWDALGKKAGLPLYKLWGAYREEVPIYGSGVFRGLGGDGMIEKARRFIGQGFKAIKMQAAHTPSLRGDIENVRRMREAIGPDIDIMIDINQGWSADTAILMGRHFEEQNVYWMEEPVPVEDFAGYLRVARALKLRVVGGESHFMRWDLRPFFGGEAPIPILQPDVIRGGLTELRKIAAVADTWHIQIAPHLYHELMSHLLGSIPNGLILEWMGWLDDLWIEPLTPKAGMVRPPDRPGHGMRFKPEILKDFRLKG